MFSVGAGKDITKAMIFTKAIKLQQFGVNKLRKIPTSKEGASRVTCTC